MEVFAFMLEMIPEEVFCPASYPNYTYIGRRRIEVNGTDVTYEDKLKKR